MSLCIIYNGPAAMTISTCMALLLCMLQNKALFGVLPIDRPHDPDLLRREDRTRVLEHGMWAQLLCPVVFTIVFFNWQQIRVALGLDTKVVFVDKFCIDQVDTDKKRAGVLGLAGFLASSERLVVCWTPRYFSRLWCTYEMASWLHLGKPLDSVLFFPIATGLTVITLGVLGQCFALSWHFGSVLSPNAKAFHTILSNVFIFPVISHVCRYQVHNLCQLPKQIAEFTILRSDCFCCSVNHQVPGVRELIPCDRRLVYKTLDSWFPTPKNSVNHQGPDQPNSTRWSGQVFSIAESMKVFNSTASMGNTFSSFDMSVHKLLGPFILHSAGPTKLAYRHLLVGLMPSWWRTLDICAAMGADNNNSNLMKYILHFVIYTFACLPCCVKIFLHVLVLLDRYIGIPKNTALNCLATLMVSLVCSMLYLILWFPLHYTSSMQGMTGLMVLLIVSACEVVLTFVLYPEVNIQMCCPHKEDQQDEFPEQELESSDLCCEGQAHYKSQSLKAPEGQADTQAEEAKFSVRCDSSVRSTIIDIDEASHLWRFRETNTAAATIDIDDASHVSQRQETNRETEGLKASYAFSPGYALSPWWLDERAQPVAQSARTDGLMEPPESNRELSPSACPVILGNSKLQMPQRPDNSHRAHVRIIDYI